MRKFTLPYTLLGICLLVLMLLESCKKDWLNIKPSIDVAVPSSLDDLQALLDNSNSSSSSGDMNQYSPALGEIASDGHYVTDQALQLSSDIEKNAYLLQLLVPYQNLYDWEAVFGKIFTCNVILEALERVAADSDIDKIRHNSIKGQALFQRARSLFEAAQIWAPPYVSDDANSVRGMPIRLSSDINAPSTRSSNFETYQQILLDLRNAVQLLEPMPPVKTRASRAAAYAMLARVYLVMGEYKNAYNFADSSLTIYNTLLDYNDIDVSTTYPFARFNNEVIFQSTLSNYLTIGSQLRIDSTLYREFEPDDIRKAGFFGINGGLHTFRGGYNGNRTPFNGIATDEIYLIKAECAARIGNLQNALSLLNKLLRTRYQKGTYHEKSVDGVGDVLQLILRERAKELLIRGLRWSDLRRLNTDPRFSIELTRTVDGKNYTILPNSYRYTFPIPQDIIQKSGMTQNPGWEN